MYNELYHHGVLGMKWGVRRYQPYSTVPRGSGEGGKEIGAAARQGSSTKKTSSSMSKSSKRGSQTIKIDGQTWKIYGGKLSPEQQKRYDALSPEQIGLGGSAANVGESRADRRQRTKEMKSKAKDYQKQMNDLQSKESQLLLKSWEYSDRHNEAIRELKRQSRRENPNLVKVDKWMNESKILTKKMTDLGTELTANRQQINSLIDKMSSDSDVVYRTKSSETYGGKHYKDFGRSMTKKYGYTGYKSNGGLRSVSGTKYVVKAGTDRNKNKKRYSDPDRKRERSHRFNTTYVYAY